MALRDYTTLAGAQVCKTQAVSCSPLSILDNHQQTAKVSMLLLQCLLCELFDSDLLAYA